MKTPPLLPPWLMIATIIAFACAMLVTMGCATTFDYRWVKTRPESQKPWFYIAVDNPDAICRSLGADAEGKLGRISACAQWQPKGCTIYLPHGAPRWLVEHEEQHCNGFSP